MISIKLLNKISPVYKSVWPEEAYSVSAEAENPQAIVVRSADMHEMEIEKSVLAVARAGAGTNNIPLEKLGKQGVVVFNTPGANANAVKELVVAGMLLASRDIVGGIEWAKGLKGEGASVAKLVEKGKGQFVGPELKGKTLGIIGLGAIGSMVANAARALEMEVVGFDPYITVDHAWMLSRAVQRARSQDEVLEKCDYLSVHVPLLNDTRGFLNAQLLKKMKKGAVILNFARGELAADADILSALESGDLRAYVTDFPNENLIGQKGVIAIPHLGASTPESEDNCVDMACRQISAYLANGTIKNSVNYPDCELEAGAAHRIAVLHANVPNTVGSITSLVAAYDINIDNMVNKSRGQFAYTVLDLDEAPPEILLDKIENLEAIYRVRSF